MKLTVNTKDLLKKLQEVGGIIKTPNQMPVLDNILFVIEPGKLKLVADNLEIRTTTEMAINEQESYSICVPYAVLISTLKGFPNAPVDLVFEERQLIIQALAGDKVSGEYKIPTFNAEEYPKNKFEEAYEYVVFNSLDFVEAIRKASMFIEDKAVDGLINLMVWITGTGTKVVGGNHQALYEYSLPSTGNEKKLLLSKSVISYLAQSITAEEDLEVSYNENHVFFNLQGRQISAIQGNVKFPDYDKLFTFWGGKVDKTWKVDTGVLIPALKRLSNLTDQNSFGIDFDFDGKSQLQMSFNHINEKCNAREVINIDYEGESLIIGLNGKHLPSILNTIDGEVTIKLHEEKSGVLVSGENIRCITMPMLRAKK